MTAQTVASWGRYPKYPQTTHAVHWRRDLPHDLSRLVASNGVTLPFGNGRSYGDSCLSVSDNVMYMRSLDRFISADWKKGIVVMEAGVTLEEILIYCIPHGWFLPVTPGTKYVTVGGLLPMMFMVKIIMFVVLLAVMLIASV